MTLRIDLKSAILALSDALDLVGVNDFQHGKRVAMIARETALMLGLPDKRLDRLVCASLLHDLGVSSTAVHRRLLHEADWDARHTTVKPVIACCSPLPICRRWPGRPAITIRRGWNCPLVWARRMPSTAT